VRGVRMHPERIRSAGPAGAWAQGCCHLLPLAASRLLPSSPAVALPGVCRQAPVRHVDVSAVCRRLPWLAALADGKGRLGPVTGCFASSRRQSAPYAGISLEPHPAVALPGARLPTSTVMIPSNVEKCGGQ
jgi:hypothetical protein